MKGSRERSAKEKGIGAIPKTSGYEEASRALDHAREALFKQQRSDGHWIFPLEADATITAEYIIYRRMMELPISASDRSAGERLLATQHDDGGWSRFEGAPGQLSLAIEAYFALKLLGKTPDEPAMERARAFIHHHGGLAEAGVFTRFWLSYFRQYPDRGIPAVPVELMLIPDRWPLSIYELSSWARGTVVPMAILQALDFRVPLEAGKGVEELWCDSPENSDLDFAAGNSLFSWKRFFWAADKLLHGLGRLTSWRPLRARSLEIAERWVRERQDSNGGWGGIIPAMLNSTVALRTLAGDDDPQVRLGHQAMEDFACDMPGGLMLQPCVSPVWDTALALKALLDAGSDPSDPRLQSSAEWLIARQVLETRGDWAVKRPALRPGGWVFEYENDYYPDVDDTAVICMVLDRIETRDPERTSRAIERGAEWMLGMQSRNGGFGAFDVDNVREFWNEIPFADMKAMLDRPVEDLTGRGLELLGHFGFGSSHPIASRALDFVTRTQQPDGSWWGRWGVNTLYGTWSVLTGLSKIGIDSGDRRVARAADWLEDQANDDGGFGESPLSYDAPNVNGSGPSTPSQTAWALMALVDAGRGSGEVAHGAAQYLLDHQNDDGTWSESEWTGTGFPGHFYLRYLGYPVFFPISALGLWLRDRANASDSTRSEGD